MLLIAALLQVSGRLFAQNIVVFAKGDTLALKSAMAPAGFEDPEKDSLLTAFTADMALGPKFGSPLELSDLPRWGRKIPGAVGMIQYPKSFHGGFILRVELGGLAPNHRYILTLNGNPKRAGNKKLVDPVPGNDKERYFDFITATTDPEGRYQAVFCIRLLPGHYDVRFYVKDTDDFKIVLYRDFFKFRME
jgi:hypothetical protein